MWCFRHFPRLVCIAVFLSGNQGCRSWNTETTDAAILPPIKAASDGIVVHVTSLRIGTEDTATMTELWNEVDEQQLSAAVRQRLAKAGFRCGIVAIQSPVVMAQLAKQTDQAQGSLAAELGNEDTTTFRRIQTRPGLPSEIVTTPLLDSLAILQDVEGSVQGTTLRRAQCLFVARFYSVGDGRVKLDLRPEIQHGETRQEWTGQDGAFRLQPGRERHLLAEQRIQANLSPGQMLAISCVEPHHGVGGKFFTTENSLGEFQKVLLIQLIESQADDLFPTNELPRTLATSQR